MTSPAVPDFPSAPDTLAPSDLAPGLHTARLANGLRVVIREDHRTPVAVCNVWVGVGSNREPEPMRGWSHGIEHMLFKGTERRGEGDFALEVSAAGGSTNAGTGYESTNYHITVPAENLPLAVDILSDALFHSRFEAESLDAEREVLVHENHMYDDIPSGFGLTWRWVCELAFDESPYRHPIGGRDENLRERPRDDIMAFWRSAYRPDNMTVVVAGDVDRDAVFALVQERFGGVDPALFAPHAEGPCAILAKPPVEGEHDGARLRVEHGDVKKVYAKMLFPSPGLNSGLDPVLAVARRVLTDGRSCRLYRRLQEETKLVDDIALLGEHALREGMLLVDLETDAERLPAALREVALVLAEMGQEGCTEVELERASTRVARSYLFGAETVQGQAGLLGRGVVNGDLAGAFDFPRRVAAVTTEDVRRFCASVFRRNACSVLLYLPEGTDAAAAGLPTTPAELEKLLTELPAAPATDVPRPAEVAVQGGRGGQARRHGEAPRFETYSLSGGVTLNCRVDRTLPLMTMSLVRAGGATDETAADAGLATLSQAVAVKGAGGLDAEALHAVLEGEGASLSPRVDRDFGGLHVSALADRTERMFEMLAATIHDPAFSEDEVAQERRLALDELASVEDSPVQAAALRLRHLVYGDHPYGRPLVGLPESLPGLDRDRLLARHRQAWHTDGLEVVAAGDIEPEALARRLEAILGKLPAGEAPAPHVAGARTPEGVVHERMVRQQNQGVVLVAWPGAAHADADRVPLALLREVLNGQSGRLFESLRNRQSLCYNTGSVGTSGFGQGFFMGYVLTAPETMEQARDALVAEITGLAGAPVPSEEFERARTELLGNILIASQSNAGRVMRAARDRIYGRDANDLESFVAAIRTCGADAVHDVAGRLFSPDARFEVFLGPGD